MNNISEKDRVDIVRIEYDEKYNQHGAINQPVRYGPNNKFLSTLDSVVDDKSTGLKMYVAVKVTNPSQIGSVSAYEGPNIYSTLGACERDTALKLRNKIHNYVDHRDAIAPGYGDVFNCIGRLHRIDSKDLGVDKISQHMWGGCQWQDDGGLVEMQPNFNDMKSALSFYREHFPQFVDGKQGEFVLDSVQAEFISDAIAAHAGQLEHNIDTLHAQTVQELRDKVSRAI